MGFPFLSGSIPKMYPRVCLRELSHIGFFAFSSGTIAAIFSTAYSLRVIYLVFLAESHSSVNTIVKVHELNLFMGVPLILLSIASIFLGYLTKDMFIGAATEFWGASISLEKADVITHDLEFIPTTVKLLPIIILILGTLLFLGFQYCERTLQFNPRWQQIVTFFTHKWHFDQIYNYFIVKPFLYFGQRVTFEIIDRGFLEWLGPYGITRFFNVFMAKLSKLITGNIYVYIFMLAFGLVILVGWAYS